jgi:hypothetical protein
MSYDLFLDAFLAFLDEEPIAVGFSPTELTATLLDPDSGSTLTTRQLGYFSRYASEVSMSGSVQVSRTLGTMLVVGCDAGSVREAPRHEIAVVRSKPVTGRHFPSAPAIGRSGTR